MDHPGDFNFKRTFNAKYKDRDRLYESQVSDLRKLPKSQTSQKKGLGNDKASTDDYRRLLQN